MDRDKLQRILDAKPLKFETSNHAIAQLQKRVNEQQEVILYLAQCIATQAASIMDIRGKMVDHKSAIEVIAEIAGSENSPEPMIVMPPTDLVDAQGNPLDVQRP